MNLLTTGNPKIQKGTAKGYLTSILHLAPHTLSGHNVCPMATAGCAAACLNTAGRGGIFKPGETTNTIQQARIRKTNWLFSDRDAFLMQLVKEIGRAIKNAKRHGLIPAIRLNGTSDLRWEYYDIMSQFPTTQFYDYTKIANRRDLPANYHLTFSLAENNEGNARFALANGMNVAAVFHTMPTMYLGVPVINGDDSDLRFLDPAGVVVGLKAKGKAKRDTTGFVK